MTTSRDPPAADKPPDHEPETVDSGTMESLETRLGRPVDPGVELDGSELETRAAGNAPPRADATAAAATDRYEARGEIARGGMGAIYEVRDKDLRRSLAMKVILGGAGTRPSTRGRVSDVNLGRFLEEAQVTAQLAHPGVVPVHELGVDAQGRVYFTMSLVRGETLAGVIERARAGTDGWSRTRALQVILRVCETMAFAHDKGVIHRDIKPANVMVGKFGQTYVMDWGLAKVLGRKDAHDIRLQDAAPGPHAEIETERSDSSGLDSPLMTMDGAVIGTPAFMPPEQAAGRIDEVDKRSDVYAIGALLYQLLTGEAPYVRTGSRLSVYAILDAVTTGPPRAIHETDPSAPEELQAICEKAMARDRAQRYASAEELADELQRFLGGHVVLAHRTGALIEMKKWVARNKAVAATAATALVLLLAGGILYSVNVSAARARAERERDAKDDALRGARVVGLVAASAEARDVDSMRSLLLARAAVRTREMPASVTALRTALDQPLESAVFSGRAGMHMRSAVYSRDGSRILTVNGRTGDHASLWSAEGDELAVLRHPARVRSADGDDGPVGGAMFARAAFSPDGSKVVTTSRDRTARIWDADGNELLVVEGHEDTIHSAAFSPDGTGIITGSSDGRVRVWNAEGEQLHESPALADPVYFVALSPDGTHAVAAFEHGLTVILADDLQTVIPLEGQSVEFQAFPPDGTCTVFSPDGQLLVTARDRTPTVWDMAGKQVAKLDGHRSRITSVAFDPGGARLLTASEDGTARLWLTDGRELAVLAGHDDFVESAAYARDGERIVTASMDATARVWTSDGKQVAVLRHETGTFAGVRAAALSPDGTRAFTGSLGGIGRVWYVDGSGSRVLLDHTLGVNAIACSTDGSRFVTGSHDGSARVRDADGTAIAVLVAYDRPAATARISAIFEKSAAEMSDDESRVLRAFRENDWMGVAVAISHDGSRVVTGAADGKARLFDAEGSQIALMEGHESAVGRVAIAQDGSRVVTCSSGGIAKLWDVNGAELAILRHGEGMFLSVGATAFSPDGARIATGDSDGVVRVWDRQGNELAALRMDDGEFSSTIFSTAFSPDGTRVVAAYMDGAARLWGVGGELLAELRHGDDESAFVPTAAFSPDGSRIVTASGDKTARIWDTRGKELAVLRGHEDSIESAAFSPDGTLVVTASIDRTARLWDTHGRELAVLRGHGNAVKSATFLPDGSRVLTVSADATTRMWILDTEGLLARADERCLRDFTDAERMRYADLLGEE